VDKVRYKLLNVQYGGSRRSDGNIKVDHIGICRLDMKWIEVAHDESTGDVTRQVRIFLFQVGYGN
jgi:hypothetical protein